MSCCVYSDIRSYQAVSTNTYFCHIKHRTVVVGVKIVANESL